MLGIVKPYRLGDPADALVIRWAIYPKEAWKASTIITAGKTRGNKILHPLQP